MTEVNRPHFYIIELDYNADPETPARDVRAAIEDELSLTTSSIKGNMVFVNDVSDAFRVKMRFFDNVVAVRPQFIA